jgi:hypothetical protein
MRVAAIAAGTDRRSIEPMANVAKHSGIPASRMLHRNIIHAWNHTLGNG